MEYTVRHNHSENWSMSQPHLHDGCELLLSLTDGGSFFLMDNLHPLRRGTLILMEDRVLHRSVAEQGEYDRYVLHIPLETLKTVSTEDTNLMVIFRQNRCLQLDEAATRQISQLMERCMSQSEGYGGDLLRNCALVQLLVAVGRLLCQPALCQVEQEGLSAPVRRAIDYVNCHMEEKLSLDILAEHCYVTKYHLCHLFKTETGFTVGEYLQRIRILRAAALLQSGESVQRAGELAGFFNNSNFIRVFTGLMGISPGRYGKRQKHGEKL